MLLLILDSLGGTELLVILVVALIIFGPRKLPQLSRSLGRSLADFKRASQDFKETWEKEARLTEEFKQDDISRSMLPPEESRPRALGVEPNGNASSTGGDGYGVLMASTAPLAGEPTTASGSDATLLAPPLVTPDAVSASLVPPPSIRPVPADASLVQNRGSIQSSTTAEPAQDSAAEQTRKQDWL